MGDNTHAKMLDHHDQISMLRAYNCSMLYLDAVDHRVLEYTHRVSAGQPAAPHVVMIRLSPTHVEH